MDRVNFRMLGAVACGIGPIDALDPEHGCGAPTENFAFSTRSDLAGYAPDVQDQVALTGPWNVVAGLRHSEFTNDNEFITAFDRTPGSADLSNTTWRLGTTYALPGGMSLFGGFNTVYDLEWVTGARRADGTPFQPETSDQVEAGLRLTRGTLLGSLSAFRVRRNDVAVPDPDSAGFQIQDGQFRVQGVELEGEWSPSPRLWLQGATPIWTARLRKRRSTARRPRRAPPSGRWNCARPDVT